MTTRDAQLLLLPGLDGSAQLFSWFVAQFPDEQQWEAVTYPADAPADWDALAEIAEAMIAKDRNIVVIAESFSGPVAMRLLSRKRIDIAAACLSPASLAHPIRFFSLGA